MANTPGLDLPIFQELDPEAPFGDVPGMPIFLLLDAECVELVQHGEPSRSAAKKLHRVCDLLACNDRTYTGLPFTARLELRDALLKHVLKDVQHPVLQTLLSKPFEPFHRLQHELLDLTERRGGAGAAGTRIALLSLFEYAPTGKARDLRCDAEYH
eukprot:g47488.t1